MFKVGTVSDENGPRYHLVAFDQAVIAAEFTSTEDFYRLRHIVSKIKLMPIGR
jgi:hypothetical protein